MADVQENANENVENVGTVKAQVHTFTLDVVCVDTYGNEYTFKLDNPKSTVTLQNVQDAFNIGINSEHWYSRAGYQFTSIKRAAKVETFKQTTPLE